MYRPSFPDAPTIHTFFAAGDHCARISPPVGCRSSRSLSLFSISPLAIVFLLFDDTEISEIDLYEHSFFDCTYAFVVRSCYSGGSTEGIDVTAPVRPKCELLLLRLRWGRPAREPSRPSRAGTEAS